MTRRHRAQHVFAYTANMHCGLTLVELLITIAIVSSVMAMLLPALGKAREMGRSVACRGNLGQIALAWNMYLDDYDGLFYKGVNHQYDFGGWQGEDGTNAPYRPLNAYLGLPKEDASADRARAFECPSDQGGFGYVGSVYRRLGNSYQANPALVYPAALSALPWCPEPWRTINCAIHEELHPVLCREQIAQPSQMLLTADHCWLTQWDPLITYACGKAWHGRHHCYHAAFMDGHTDEIKIRKGLYLTADYRFQPFQHIDSLVLELQEQAPCACGRE